MTGPFWTRPMAGWCSPFSPTEWWKTTGRGRSPTRSAMADEAQRNARFFNQGEFQTGQSDVRIFRFEQNDGTLLLGGGTVEVHGQDLRISDGIVAGSGQIVTDVTQTGGVISPGNSPGILNIDGDLDAAGGSLRVEIAGPPIDDNEGDAAGVHFDRLNVSGTATIAELDVDVLGDFLPTLGSRYLVLQANSLTGPAGDNAADVGMTIPSSDEVVELVVANELNTEPIADAGGPYVSDEGSAITFDASRSTDAEQSSDSLTYQWDFDYDGVVFDPEATGRTVTRSLPNQISQRTVAVLVRDSSGFSYLATTTFQVNNVAPQLADGSGSPSITIDGSNLATLTGEFTDPGVDDTHSLEVTWGDGSFERFELSPGERSFSVTHPYSANDTGAARDFTVEVSIADETESNDRASLNLTQPFTQPAADR